MDLFGLLCGRRLARLWYVAPGGGDGMLRWALFCLFGIGFVGMEFATIFTNALMPTLDDRPMTWEPLSRAIGLCFWLSGRPVGADHHATVSSPKVRTAERPF